MTINFGRGYTFFDVIIPVLTFRYVPFFFNLLHFILIHPFVSLFFRDKRAWIMDQRAWISRVGHANQIPSMKLSPVQKEGRKGKGPVSRRRRGKGLARPSCCTANLRIIIIKVVVGRWRVISDNLCFEQKFSFTWVVSWKRDLDRISFRQGVFPRERMEAIKERALSPPSFIIPPKKKILIMTNPLLALVQYLNDNIFYPRWSVSPRLCDSQRLNILLSPMSILLRINI